MKRIVLLFIFFALATVAQAQPSSNVANRIKSGLNANKGSTCQVGSIYLATDTGHEFLCPAGTWVDFGAGSGGGGTVTSVSMVSANGLAGTVATATTTPAITLTTTITGLLKGNGTAISAASAGTDYVTASSTNTFTNKTYDTAGSGNSFSINGVAVTANTGSGAVARAANPVFTGPTLGVAVATSLNGNTFTTGTYTLTGTAAKTFTFSNTLTLAGTDGSTLNVGTGGTLGSNAFTSTAYAPIASPTFTGTVTIPTPFTLGATSVTSTGMQLNYLNAATGTTGTASTNVVFSASPTLTGTATITGATTTGPDFEVAIPGDTNSRVAIGINTTDVARVSFGPGNAVRDLFIERMAAATVRWGAPDAPAPVAQLDTVQNVVAGTSNTAGANRTWKGSAGTGTGVGGSLIWQVAPAGSTETAQNAFATAVTIASDKSVTLTGVLSLPAGSSSVAAVNFGSASSGLYAPTTGQTGWVGAGVVGGILASTGMFLPAAGGIFFSNSTNPVTTADTNITRNAAADLRLGYVNSASPVNYQLGAENSRPGTDSNVGGATLTIKSGTGTGTGTPSTLNLSSPVAVGSGTGVQTQTVGLQISSGNVIIPNAITINAGKALNIASGTNQRAGNATLVGGTVTVSNTTVTANTVVMLTRKTSGGTIGTAITYTVSAGTSFTISSDNILDTSTFSFFLLEVP